MATTEYKVEHVTVILNDLRNCFGGLGIRLPQFTITATTEENRFSLQREIDGKLVSVEISGSALRRLKENLFGGGKSPLSLLVGCVPTSNSAFAFAEALAEKEEEEKRKAEEARLARLADEEERVRRTEALAGSGLDPAILARLQSLPKDVLDSLFDKVDNV